MPGYELLGSEERHQVNDVFDNGGVLYRQGFNDLRKGIYKVQEFESNFGSFMGSAHALAVTSGTMALRVALAALGIGEGDEVITQAFTFVATVEAIIEARAKPVCVNIDSSLNMDPDDLVQAINGNTKAVIAVHMLGTPADIKRIRQICDDYNIYLIEDTAWGCGGKMSERYLGTWGDIGTFSFDYAKAMTTGEGGMLLFREESIWKRAIAWHDHGHENNPLVPRWMDTRSSSGFNCRMNELQGAVGLAQLEKLSHIIDRQRSKAHEVWKSICQLPGIEARMEYPGSYSTYDSLIFFVPTSEIAVKCKIALNENQVSTKILPEAISWHFAGEWSHMDELVKSHNDLSSMFLKSRNLLSRAISLPMMITSDEEIATKVLSSLSTVLI